MKLLCTLLANAVLGLLLQGCGGGNNAPPIKATPAPDEQWTLSAPAEADMDGALLEQAAQSLPANHGLASMLVLRHGKPVFERYWNGYDKDSLHDLRSATKSITSLMVGIAIDQGMLSGVDESIATRLNGPYPNTPGLTRGITLAHLLTMRSGQACNDFSASSPGQEDKMYKSTDWVRFFLDLPAGSTPGSATFYCTGGVVTLGRIVSEASKRPIPEFAGQYLFTPLGIRDARWASFDSKRQTDTGGHIAMRPRDMARIGQLVLQKGQWQGRQLVSSAWIAQATASHTAINDTPYGYLWWMREVTYQGRSIKVHYADGNGGQFIFVVPELDLVAVFTGENYNSPKAQQGGQILVTHILPAVR
ncbi:serine hydrolase [Massilia sp. CF038]|uniref:serine hydrolase domain-containing protein n=1 Tax=Massilia sp. CF038 TaxID=1881045 RepID=UPI00091C73FB|nr:serine hydrolase domain-containing protein [Massilia sp. CF038]SHG40408.1 CubicO group peptidase, beta-lactamase class C family [Massilia sp. CF038]